MREEILGALGTTVWFPYATRLVRPHRVRRPKLVSFPAFSSYVFVRLDDGAADWRSMCAGFIHPVRTEREIAVVEEEIIVSLKVREAAGDFATAVVNRALRFQPGTAVTIRRPAFNGTQGVITEVLVPGVKVRVALPNMWIKAGVSELEVAEG